MCYNRMLVKYSRRIVMKKSIFRGIGAFLITAAILFNSFGALFISAAEPTTYSKDVNSGERDVIATTLNGTSAASYYTGNNTYDKLSKLSADALKTSLNKLMKDTHSYESSYNDCHYKANKTDCENGDSTTLSLIYTSYTATQSQWNGWNREHVWPKSLGGGDEKGGGADLHHIRPSDALVNSTRSNDRYGNVSESAKKVYGNNPAKDVLGGYSNGTYFEPLDNVKGDVARICLYVYVRWGSEWGATDITKVFQNVNVLLEWCELDPVDIWELGRNEVVGKIQGNRNVFIDYPEYAWLIFGKAVPTDMTTPSGMAKSGSGNSGSGTTTPGGDTTTPGGDTTTPGGGTTTPEDEFPAPDPTCTHAETEKRGVKAASCTETGYTGDTVCKKCNGLIEKDTILLMKAHGFSEWTVNKPATIDEAGEKSRSCTVCGKVETATVPKIDPETCEHSKTELTGVIEASCEEEGYSGDTVCTVCGTVTKKGAAVNATGHKLGEWVTVKEATADSIGISRRTCSVCEHSEDTVIPRLEADNSTTVVIVAASGGTVAVGAILFFIIRKKLIGV